MGRSEEVRFLGSHGVELAGRLEWPAGAPRACAVFAHCFTCSKDVHAASRVSRALAARGIAVLRFDFTGLGGSDGEFENTNFSSNVQDLVAAADHLRQAVAPPELLVGHSLGGAAVLVAAHEVPECKLVATIGAPFDPAHVKHLLRDRIEEIDEKQRATVVLAGRSFTIQKQFLDDLERQRQEQLISKLGRALMVFHSPTDETVGIENAREVYEAARHPKSFVSLDGADHLLTNPQDAEYVGATLAAWVGRHLPTSTDELPEQPHAHALVRETRHGKFQQALRLGTHEAYADEPIEYGGDDSGPSPYELLLGALGSCTAMTLRMYADHKKWPLQRISVYLSHAKRHAQDCRDCENQGAKLDAIEREIVLEGELSPEQRTRLIEIANKCPVHRTLLNEVRIATRERHE